MRKKMLLRACVAVAFASGVGLAGPVSAQQLELPRASPQAKLSQVVGMTEIAVDYSSPAVKGRKVWGGLVPLGELWRTGANQATKVTFSKDVTIGDKPVPAGTYALFTIPTKDSWTVIFNKNPNQGGTDQYKQDLDQLRLTVKPLPAPHRERLTFVFTDTSEVATTLDLEWEKVRLPISIKAGTEAQVAAKRKIGFAAEDMRLYRGQTLAWRIAQATGARLMADYVNGHLARGSGHRVVNNAITNGGSAAEPAGMRISGSAAGYLHLIQLSIIVKVEWCAILRLR